MNLQLEEQSKSVFQLITSFLTFEEILILQLTSKELSEKMICFCDQRFKFRRIRIAMGLSKISVGFYKRKVFNELTWEQFLNHMIVITQKIEERKTIFNHNIEIMRQQFGSEIVKDDKDLQVLPFIGYYSNGYHIHQIRA